MDTAPYLEKYPIDNNQKFYFIQDYENWGRTDQEVRNTYHYKMNKIVISKWLLNIVTNEEAEKCTLVPNGFNLKEFYLTIPIKRKNVNIRCLCYIIGQTEKVVPMHLKR